jgi:aryl-alcohol dehydrogenase-like predicted oxidoreductase
MEFITLGRSDLRVSRLCLGTMTFGEQNSESDAHAQLDYAVERGINFIDAAEMYPVPAKAETQGRTEQYVGSWLRRQQREQLIVATKIAGPSRGLQWIRNPLALDASQIGQAIDGSLQRLQTDYVDLYQIHWPARNVPMFGGTQYDPVQEGEPTDIRHQLDALAAAVAAGKVRHIGLSNETPWGVSQFTRLAEQHGLPRVVSIQNAASLVNRTFENGLAETCHREQVSLLAYSALAFGYLSGKYLANPQAEGRITRFPAFGQRYSKPNLQPAVAAYIDLARTHGLNPSQMALAWTNSRWWVASTIVGATNLTQLRDNIDAASLTLSQAVLDGIEAIHLRYPNPAP